MMLAVMYGMIPSAKIEKLSKRTLLAGRLTQLFDRDGVDARDTDLHAEAVHRHHGDDEQDLVAKVMDPEDVQQVRDHAGRSFFTSCCSGR
jgi:hypothetical protein